MLLTDEQIQNIVQQMESFNSPDDQESILFLKNLWDSLPEPKHQQPEQISNWIIDCIFETYFNMGCYIEAKEWALKGLKNDTAEEGAYEHFQVGRVCYELEEYDEAMKYFSIAYDRGKKRAFKEYDKKYWEFYSKNKR